MNNLSEKMQERLDQWRKNTLAIHSAVKLKPQQSQNRGGKGDFGDVASLEEWEEEVRKSQTRK